MHDLAIEKFLYRLPSGTYSQGRHLEGTMCYKTKHRSSTILSSLYTMTLKFHYAKVIIGVVISPIVHIEWFDCQLHKNITLIHHYMLDTPVYDKSTDAYYWVYCHDRQLTTLFMSRLKTKSVMVWQAPAAILCNQPLPQNVETYVTPTFILDSTPDRKSVV